MIFANIDVSHLDFKSLPYKITDQNDTWPKHLIPVEGRGITQYFESQPESWEPYPGFQEIMDSLFHPYVDSFINRQEPGQYYAPHTDRFERMRKRFGVQVKDCLRIMIFLEDWQMGHYFEIGKKPFTDWKAGDVMAIPPNVVHLSMNGGWTQKYTWQIQGLRKDFKVDMSKLI
tara:strand:+ start:777 stop:1295 length:519 start_codon:yes stop_codon:yes gene_type:complete